MSATSKALFAFLAVCLVFSLMAGYAGITRLRRAEYPPFNTGLYTALYSVPHPSNEMVLFLDSRWGRVLMCVSALVIPVVSVVLAFGKGFRFLGLGLLASATALYAVGGLSLFFHSVFDTSIG